MQHARTEVSEEKLQHYSQCWQILWQSFCGSPKPARPSSAVPVAFKEI